MCKWINRLICLGVFGGAVYAAYIFGMPYYRFYALKSDVKDIARFEFTVGQGGKDKALIEEILKRAAELGVPLTEANIALTEKTLTVRWSKTADLLGIYQRRLDFTVDVPRK